MRMPQINISQWVSQHIRAAISSCEQLRSARLTTTITLITIGISLTLPVALMLCLKNAHALTEQWDQGTSLTVYFEPEASTAATNKLVQKYRENLAVSHIDYLSAQEALAEFKALTKMESALAHLNKNPLPAVMTIHPVATLETSALEAMAEALRMERVIAEVTLDWQWIARLQAMLAVLTIFTFIISIFFCVGVIFVVGNTIRLILDNHREEIDIHALIGATYAYVRRPFLYRGCILGLGGALLATIFIFLSLSLLSTPVSRLAALYDSDIHLISFNFAEWMALFLVGGVMGWLGAWIAVRQQWHIVNQGLTELCPS